MTCLTLLYMLIKLYDVGLFCACFILYYNFNHIEFVVLMCILEFLCCSKLFELLFKMHWYTKLSFIIYNYIFPDDALYKRN